MSKSVRFLTRYEREVRISLLLLILFLFLMNLVTLFLFNSTRGFLRQEFNQKLVYLGNTVRQAFGSTSSPIQLSSELRNLSSGEDLLRIDIYAESGQLYSSSHPDLSVEPLTKRLSTLSAPEQFPVLPTPGNIRRNQANQAYLDYFYPLLKLSDREKNLAVIRVNAQPLASLEKSSRITFWLVAVGFVSAFLITIILIKTTLKPYQAIKQEAVQANLLQSTAVERDNDLMVETFKKTIAELKEKEKILQELYHSSRQRAEDLSRLNEYILSGMQSGVIICNPQGEITKVNRAALKILQSSEEQLVGLKFFDCFGEESPLAQLVQKALLERSTSLGQELKLTVPEGRELVLEVNTSLIENEQGELLGVTLLLTDITQLAALRQELLSKERMAAIGEMAAGLAHQLRNSLGAIYGFANLLKKSIGEPNRLSGLVEDVGKESRALETLVEKFLNFSKPLELQIERIDLRQIIQESLEAVRRHTSTVFPNFEFNSEGGTTTIWADRLLLGQCFQNLFQNALEAMPQGGNLTVTLRENQWQGCPGILIEVTDTGTGLAEKEIGKIFEPFYSTKESGTGLGLSVTRKIIAQHRGKIEVQSKKGSGTIFKIYLPVKRVEAPVPA